jgi:hypothetical protein
VFLGVQRARDDGGADVTPAEATRCLRALCRDLFFVGRPSLAWVVEWGADDATLPTAWAACAHPNELADVLIALCRREQVRTPEGTPRVWCRHRRQAHRAVMRYYGSAPPYDPMRADPRRQGACDAIRAAVPCPTLAELTAATPAERGT